MAEGQKIIIPRSEQPIGLFFFLLILVHLIDILWGRMGTNSIPPELMLAIYIGLLPGIGMFWFRGDTTAKTLRSALALAVLGAISYLLPALAYRIEAIGVSHTIVATILVFFPLYPLLIFFTHEPQLGKFWKVFMGTYFVIWLILVIYSNPAFFQEAAQETARIGGFETVSVSPGELIVTRWQKFVTGVQSLTETTQNQTQLLIRRATGEAYASKVEQAKKVSVAMSAVETTQPEFTIADSVGVFAKLQVQDLEDSITITANCSAKDPKNTLILPEQRDYVHPQEEARISKGQSITIDCGWVPGTFGKGKNTMTVSASFGMDEFAFLRTYFMTQQRLDELLDEGIDPLDNPVIIERKPITETKSGPVRLGIGFDNPPVGIDIENAEYLSIVGLSLTNQWQGKVTGIEKVYLLLPKGFSISGTQDLSGTATVTPVTCAGEEKLREEEICDDGQANPYLIIPDAPVIEKDKTVNIRVRIRAPSSEYEKIFDAGPISPSFFSVFAHYEYTLEQSRVIDIQEITAGGVGGLPAVDPKLSGAPTIAHSGEATIVSFATDISAPTEISYCRGSSTALCSRAETGISSGPSSIQHSHNITGLEQSTLYSYDIYALCTSENCRTGGGKVKINSEALSFATP